MTAQSVFKITRAIGFSLYVCKGAGVQGCTKMVRSAKGEVQLLSAEVFRQCRNTALQKNRSLIAIRHSLSPSPFCNANPLQQLLRVLKRRLSDLLS